MLLRRMQYRVADDPAQSCRVARMMIFGKVYNARWSVERTKRDHGFRINEEAFQNVSEQLAGSAAADSAGDSSGQFTWSGGRRCDCIFSSLGRHDSAGEGYILFS